jgi:hypothetical protein
MPVVTLTSAPEVEALDAPGLVEGSSAGSSAVVEDGGVARVAGVAGVAGVADVSPGTAGVARVAGVAGVAGVADVEGGAAGSADCARAGAAQSVTAAAAAKARRLFIGMHAPICEPPHPTTQNPRLC